MPWQPFAHCACCQECVHLDGVRCRLHGHRRRLCNGACPDRTLAEPDVNVLTAEERARCEQLMMHPAAQFPWLTLDEMRRLLWYREYFGQREHERPT